MRVRNRRYLYLRLAAFGGNRLHRRRRRTGCGCTSGDLGSGADPFAFLFDSMGLNLTRAPYGPVVLTGTP